MLSDFGHVAMDASVAGRTHPGQRRTENQDNFLITDLSAGEHGIVLRSDGGDAAGPISLAVGAKGALLLVADGMGGAAAGRLASGLACTFILAELQNGWQHDRELTPRQFAFRLMEAVEKANGRIHLHSQRNAETIGMGSTVTAAGVYDGYLYVAQVGDSRAYLVRSGVATQITHDQSLVQHMIDAGALSPEDAERSEHGNVILQALGVKAEVTVDVTYQELRRDDFLVVCSDGLYRVVRPDEIADAVMQLYTPEAVCEHLIHLANDRGGPDNVTVAAGRFGGNGLTDPRPADRVARTPFTLVDLV